jgi:hypothetical protein
VKGAWARLCMGLAGLEKWPEYAAEHRPSLRREHHRRIHGKREAPPWRHVPSHGSHHRYQPTNDEPDPTERPEKEPQRIGAKHADLVGSKPRNRKARRGAAGEDWIRWANSSGGRKR